MLFGGPSPEHDVSIVTGLTAARALGNDVEAVYWTKGGEFFLVEPGLEAEAFVQGVPKGSSPAQLRVGEGFVTEKGGLGRRSQRLDVSAVVNCCHGGPGEDGTLQGLLDLAGLRYTGPTVAGAALGMDKLAFAALVRDAGLPHLPCATPTTEEAPFEGPYIVKPRFGGSSLGIEVVADWPSVLALVRSRQPLLRDGAIVEPYREGAYDLNISIRSHPELQLSPIEKPGRTGEILDYGTKYGSGEGMAGAPRELPADIPPEWEKTIIDAATQIAHLARVRGVARLDFLAAGDDLYVNEINNPPGSLSFYLWQAADPPVPFARLLQDMLAEATSGPARQFSTQGADGSALRSARSISGKLG